VAFLHQYQRLFHIEKLSNGYFREVLGGSKVDEEPLKMRRILRPFEKSHYSKCLKSLEPAGGFEPSTY
jgi:hypothetical protein